MGKRVIKIKSEIQMENIVFSFNLLELNKQLAVKCESFAVAVAAKAISRNVRAMTIFASIFCFDILRTKISSRKKVVSSDKNK